jgi:transcription elongation GreA/GreB family factor
MLSKSAIIERLCDDLVGEIADVARAAQNTLAGATHEEAKPENDKDTRSVEAAYLAGAQAERVRDLEQVLVSLKALDVSPFLPGRAVSSGALVELDLDGARLHCLLAPQGGGLRAAVDGCEVQVLTPQSPLGRVLLARREGDVVELELRGKMREYEIVRVS